MKKPSKKTLKLRADKLFRDKVRSLGRCELRGLDHIECSGDLQTMHIIGRSNHRLRWELLNSICGCSGHHFWYTNNPFYFFELVKREFPGRYEFVTQYKNTVWDKDIESVIARLQV